LNRINFYIYCYILYLKMLLIILLYFILFPFEERSLFKLYFCIFNKFKAFVPFKFPIFYTTVSVTVLLLDNELYSLRILSYVPAFHLLTQLGISIVLGIMIINILKNDSFQIDIVAHVNVSGELSFLEETLHGIGITTSNINRQCIILLS